MVDARMLNVDVVLYVLYFVSCKHVKVDVKIDAVAGAYSAVDGIDWPSLSLTVRLITTCLIRRRLCSVGD